MASRTKVKGLYIRGSVYWTKLSVDGKPVYRSTETSDLATAKQILDVRRGEIAKSTYQPQVDHTKYDDLVADLKSHYRQTGDRKLGEVEKRLKHLDKVFVGMKASRIDAPAVGRYVERRKEQGVANGTRG